MPLGAPLTDADLDAVLDGLGGEDAPDSDVDGDEAIIALLNE